MLGANQAVMLGLSRGSAFDITTLPGVHVAYRWNLGALDASDVACTDGVDVKTWQDQSGNGWDAVQTLASSQPTYRSAGNIDFTASAFRNLIVDTAATAVGNDVTCMARMSFSAVQAFSYPVSVGSHTPFLFRSAGSTSVWYGGPEANIITGLSTSDTMHDFVMQRTTSTTKGAYDSSTLSSDYGITEPTWATMKITSIGRSSTSALNKQKGFVLSTAILTQQEISDVQTWLNS